MRKIAILLILFVLQGCTTFRIGDLESTQLISSNNIETTSYSLPIILKFHSTQGMGDKQGISTTKDIILKTVAKHFPNQSIAFQSNNEIFPEKYLSISILRDIPDAEREDEPTGFKLLTAVFSGVTALILPYNDIDIENHIRISHIENNQKLKSTLYNQNSRRLIGFSVIPAAIFFDSDSSLSASLSEAIQEYLKNEA